MNKIFKNKLLFIITIVITAILLYSTYKLIYSISLLNNIENLIRKIAIIVIIIGVIIVIIEIIKSLFQNKKTKSITFSILTIIYSIIAIFISQNIEKVYSTLSNVTTKTSKYSASIVTLINNPAESIADIKNKDIGIINDETSIVGYQVPKYIMEKNKLKNKLVYFDSFTELIEQLFSNEIEYIFLPTNYKILFSNIDGFEYDLEKTKIIHSDEKIIEKANTEETKKITEPFTMLLMGVDSEKESIRDSSFNGDALMLITFNPQTLNTTMLSIPRDTYVPIACFAGKKENKITHAAWYGEDCMIDTIENFTGINIDYYVKINFKGVAKLVDALGGIIVDVPYQLCEQNSSRQWGNNTVYIDKVGVQKLNGEQALALARNRHKPNDGSEVGRLMATHCPTYNKGARNDFVRGNNQQLVVKAMLSQLKNIKSLNQIYDILDTIEDNMETNMDINKILSFYNVGKDILSKSKNSDINNIIKVEKLYLSGYSKTIYDQSMKKSLYNYIPYQGSIKDIVYAMKVNLGKEQPKIIKYLDFDINEPYSEKIIGKGYYKEAEIELLPNFIGKDIATVKEYFKKHDINLDIEYITSNDKNDFIGKVVSQSLKEGIHIKYINKSTGMKVKVVEKVNIITDEFDYGLCQMEENAENPKCLLGNYVGKTIDDLETFIRKTKLSIIIEKIEIDVNDPLYDPKYIGYIVEQNIKEGTPLKDLINKTIKVKYIKKNNLQEENEEIEQPENPGNDIPEPGNNNDDENNEINNPITDILPNNDINV